MPSLPRDRLPATVFAPRAFVHATKVAIKAVGPDRKLLGKPTRAQRKAEAKRLRIAERYGLPTRRVL